MEGAGVTSNEEFRPTNQFNKVEDVVGFGSENGMATAAGNDLLGQSPLGGPPGHDRGQSEFISDAGREGGKAIGHPSFDPPKITGPGMDGHVSADALRLDKLSNSMTTLSGFRQAIFGGSDVGPEVGGHGQKLVNAIDLLASVGSDVPIGEEIVQLATMAPTEPNARRRAAQQSVHPALEISLQVEGDVVVLLANGSDESGELLDRLRPVGGLKHHAYPPPAAEQVDVVDRGVIVDQVDGPVLDGEPDGRIRIGTADRFKGGQGIDHVSDGTESDDEDAFRFDFGLHDDLKATRRGEACLLTSP